MSGRIVLASTSAIRRRILTDAGVDFDAESPGVDEDAIKDAMADATAEEVARALASAKAQAISKRRPDDWVLGGDQVLRFDGKLYDKVGTMAQARNRLENMRGQPHELVGAIALARDGAVLACHTEVSRMEMRDFSDAFLDAYLERAGEGILGSVGCYQYENLGAQLFERVDGDFFAILGLPLLPVLGLLRLHGALT